MCQTWTCYMKQDSFLANCCCAQTPNRKDPDIRLSRIPALALNTIPRPTRREDATYGESGPTRFRTGSASGLKFSLAGSSDSSSESRFSASLFPGRTSAARELESASEPPCPPLGVALKGSCAGACTVRWAPRRLRPGAAPSGAAAGEGGGDKATGWRETRAGAGAAGAAAGAAVKGLLESALSPEGRGSLWVSCTQAAGMKVAGVEAGVEVDLQSGGAQDGAEIVRGCWRAGRHADA
eukprot:4997648-Pleurochrysis_carterae.AAC.2